MQNITLAILAGGKARRLGGIDKALIKVDGIPIISRIYNTFKDSVTETIIISNSSIQYPIPAKIFPDIIPNCGPLGGIHSALSHSSFKTCFVISADMPFPNLSIFKKLLAAHKNSKVDITIPKHDDLIEPLFGFYNKNTLNIANQILSDGKGHRVAELFRFVKTSYLELPNTNEMRISFYNINTPDDLNALKL
ncbi:molybdenum cofactor guanylyltransferase [Tenuifilum thalassicum]|uniref:Probable molybdenum cofactor guanylyltransferase n=1 Tax=Tenuifilum thalassicum TaxID=2590900 RepID=A0A7D3XDC0_9BACT|nr:molybdenum cofactor guanylyltransferase [Tenuifilum thalassicum]QKG79592.1 molybdenum cofactor guanylyltransferase [Tenuifilum thalassicum]